MEKFIFRFIFAYVVINIVLGAAAPCNPLLSEGSHGKLDVNGHTTLQCDISTCDKVGKVVFEKQSIDRTRQWTPVFEGYNKTSYRSLDTGYSYYSLKDRHEYSTFHSEHILFISPLTIQDQGEWRCVVYDKNMKRKESQPTKITLVSSCTPAISEGSHGELHISGYTTFECDIDSCSDVSKIIFEKTFMDLAGNWTPVYEGISKTHYRALDTNISGYSLANRNDYTTFHTRHVLYIEPLVLIDEGNWRCIVFDQYQRHMVSRETNLYLVSSCKPTISKHITNKLEMGGFTTIECSIKGCETVSKITFEKTFIDRPTEWISVYEGINETYHKVLDTNITGYSLKDRNGYTSLSTRHVLYIEPLVPKDQGKWRCTVYDQYTRPIVSSAMEFNLETPCKPEISEQSQDVQDIGGKTAFECDISTCKRVSRVHFEKTDIQQQTLWTPVYEWNGKTKYHALTKLDRSYSLENRSNYAVFPNRHLLYIDPLMFGDQGDWRCKVSDQNYRQSRSRLMSYNLGTPCKPELAQRRHDRFDRFKEISLECDFSSCINVFRIEYEKKGIKISSLWSPVYQGINVTSHFALYTNGNYSLGERSSYTVFQTRHTVHIKPPLLEDEGEWRCVVYDQFKRRPRSKPIHVSVGKHSMGDNNEVTFALWICLFVMSAAALVLLGYQAKQILCKEHTDAGDDVESKGTSSTFDTGDDNDYKDQLLQHSSFEDLETSEDSQSSEFLSRRILKDITQLRDSGCSVGSDILLSIERLTSSSNNIYDEGFNESGRATYSVIKKVETCNGDQSTQTECNHMERKETETDNGCTKDIQMQTDCVAVSNSTVQTQNVEQKEVGIQTSDDPAANCELVSFVATVNDSIEKIQFIMEEIAKIITVDIVVSNTQRSHNICPLEQPMNRCYEMLRNIRLSIVSLGGRRPGSIDEQSAGCSLINHKDTDFIDGKDIGLFKDQAITHILKRPGEEHKDENTHPQQSVTNQTGGEIFGLAENGASIYPLTGHNSTKTTNEENQIKLVIPESTSQVKMQGRIEEGDLVQLLHSKNEGRRSTTNSKGIGWHEDMSRVTNQTGGEIFGLAENGASTYPLNGHNSTKTTHEENQIKLVSPESTSQVKMQGRIKEGDFVQLIYSENEVRRSTKGIGWNEDMSRYLGLHGVVVNIRSDGSVTVRFINNKIWIFKPVVLRKVNLTGKKPEIADCVIVTTNEDDLEFLQKQIGEWMRNMEKKCGKFGILRDIQDNYMLIEIDGSTFKFNKKAIRLVAKGGEYTELMTKRSDTV